MRFICIYLLAIVSLFTTACYLPETNQPVSFLNGGNIEAIVSFSGGKILSIEWIADSFPEQDALSDIILDITKRYYTEDQGSFIIEIQNHGTVSRGGCSGGHHYSLVEDAA